MTNLASQQKVKLLVVGQTPPPFHGQAIMIKNLVEGEYEGVDLHHVRMGFSDDMSAVGKVDVAKILMLLPLVLKLWYWRCRGYRNLYYPPASGNLVPILRDIVLLGCTRFLFRKTIFHFHSADLTQAYDRIPRWLKPFYRAVYFQADLGVVVAKNSGVDLKFLQCRKVAVIPNAVDDLGMICRSQHNGRPPIILYVGAVSREKGLLHLLEASQRLAQKQIAFRVEIVGLFRDEGFRDEFCRQRDALGLSDRVHLHGRVTCDDKKRQIYQDADLFCFPTYYAAETFGIVLIEAMSCGLPVVATDWRGIPETVIQQSTGLLVEPRNSEALAGGLERLLCDRDLRIRMGRFGRRRYEQHFTLEVFRERFGDEFRDVCV